jgi:hypothetical protein
VNGQVWCRSCDSVFESDDLVVDADLVTHPGSELTGVLFYGSRCLSCGAKGVWVLTNPRGGERELVSGLRRADTALDERGVVIGARPALSRGGGIPPQAGIGSRGLR